ncbi:YlbG family protein [Hutsoniella sourekii]
MVVDSMNRKKLIVWLYSTKNTKNLRSFGYVHYVSQKMKYAVMYTDHPQVDQVIKEIESLHYVRAVEPSYQEEVQMDFSQVLPELTQQMGDSVYFSNEDQGDFFEEIAESLKQPGSQEEPADESR